MRSILRAGALALAGSFALALAPAQAANNLPAKDANAAAFKYCAIDTGADGAGVHVFVPCHLNTDASGAAIFTGGNPGFVSVTNFPATWAITATSLPLPSGAATSVLQGTGNASLASIDAKTPALTSGRVPVDGSGVTQPVSAASLPLPAGAATAAKQPALGTPGSPASDVLSVQGVPGGKVVPVDTVVQGTVVDRGGTLTGASQQFAGANGARRGILIQNKSTSDFNFNCRGLTAADDEHNLRISAGAAYDTPPHHSGTGVCNGIGTSGGKILFLEY